MRSALATLFLRLLVVCPTCDAAETRTEMVAVHAFVSKVERGGDKEGWYCRCYNVSTEARADDDDADAERECRCAGRDFREVPIDLGERLRRITLTDTDATILERDAFQPYRFTLQEVFLGNLPTLRVIEGGTFRGMTNLRTLYISHAPQLTILHGLFEGFESTKFLSLRIVQTSLMEIPDLSSLRLSEYILHMVDLEGNKIATIGRNAINVSAEQVIFNYNEIERVEEHAFEGSQIGKINMRGNRRLTRLAPLSFGGLEGLLQLDVSETSITSLPAVGLRQVEVLKAENAPSLKRIPSVYDLPNLREASLTHHFHCCAFRYPERHDPVRHARHEALMRRACEEQRRGRVVRRRRGRDEEAAAAAADDDDDDDDWAVWGEGFEFTHEQPAAPNDFTPNLEHLKAHPNASDHSHLDPLTGTHVAHQAARPPPQPDVLGIFHNAAVDLSNVRVSHFACGNLTRRPTSVRCRPTPDALNPCEDIMGSNYLRVSAWLVAALAVAGNLAVVCVVLFSGGEPSVPRFLMSHLAFADLCMGAYLLLIACMDLRSMGGYFNHAFDWQYGVGCRTAGFLTVFASQLSVYTLTMVTVERWFAIAHAIHLARRVRLGVAAKVMVVGWAYAVLMAGLPLVGVSSYSATSICLPMDADSAGDRAYLVVMILVDGLAFGAVVFCYAQIYFSLAVETRRNAGRGEMTIAKKMALLVFTDFACWAPVAFFALTALAGYPLIGVTRSKILLVFFYPLNSCANPYLYAIMTAQYRKDFFVLLARLGLFKNKAKKCSITHTAQTNNTPIPLLTRTNGRKTSVAQTSALEDMFV